MDSTEEWRGQKKESVNGTIQQEIENKQTNKQNLGDLCDFDKTTNIHVIRIPDEVEEDMG